MLEELMKKFLSRILKHLCVFACPLTILFSNFSYATEVRGYLNTGVWYLKNDLASNPVYVSADGYGQSYVQGSFTLVNANLDMNILHMNDPDSDVEVGANIKGRGLFNPFEHQYSLAPPNKYRYQADEANIQLGLKSSDLWFGRHTIYETGGVGVDGATALFHATTHTGIGIYGGLGNDPRMLTGYIGPSYKTVPFSADFQAGGAFTKIHYDKFQMDLGVNTLVYKHKKIDRSNFYTQYFWNATPAWSFSGILDAGFMGDKGLTRGMLMISTKITPKISNRLSFSQFRSLFYKYSNVSAIPVPSTINPAFAIGTTVDTSNYYLLRDEIQLKFNQNYIFTSGEFARRTFDDRNRFKYTLGYFDPELFESEYDLRTQIDIINNFVGFNSDLDLMIGRSFANDRFRTEVGGTFYANERSVFASGAVVDPKGEIEKESAARANFEWTLTHKLSWILNYAYYTETDVVNKNQKVHTHDIYFASNVRF